MFLVASVVQLPLGVVFVAARDVVVAAAEPLLQPLRLVELLELELVEHEYCLRKVRM